MQADLSHRADRRTGTVMARWISLRDLHLVLPPSHFAVRNALKSILGALSGLPIATDDFDTVQSVLAEILNNVVEHAHRDGVGGSIQVRLHHEMRLLAITVLDDGAEMPGGTLPAGRDDWDVRALPEGGFGWFLIRQLVDDLSYTREAGINRVSFCLHLAPHR